MARMEFKGAAVQTTLVAGITSGSTSFSIAASTNWPTGAVGSFVCVIDPGLSSEEKILCSALSGGVLTVTTRGYDGTTASAHNAGATIYPVASAVWFDATDALLNFHTADSLKATPVDADEIPMVDSAASFGFVRLTWANLKATLLTYFNSATQVLTNKTLTSPVENNPYITSPKELLTINAGGMTGTVNFDVLTQGILYYTGASTGNATLNFRGNAGTTLNSLMNVGDSWSAVFMNTNTGTPYYPTAFQVDGSAITPKWSGGTAPSAGNANAIDAYSFTIIKTAAATFTVLAGGPVKFA